MQQRCYPLVNTFQQPPLDGHSNHRGDHGFGRRFDILGPVRRVPAIPPRRDDGSPLRDEQGFKWLETFRSIQQGFNGHAGTSRKREHGCRGGESEKKTAIHWPHLSRSRAPSRRFTPK